MTRLRRHAPTRCVHFSGALSQQHQPVVRRNFKTAAATSLDGTVTEIPGFFPDRRLVEYISLPCLRDCYHFVNLTNGLEAFPKIGKIGLTPAFVRITSTSLEQQQFQRLLDGLDANVLMHLALGHCCLMYDYGSRNKKRGASRAIWYGIEFIRFALRMIWTGTTIPAYLRGCNVGPEFEIHVRSMDKSTRKRIRYYKQFIPPHLLQEGFVPQLYGMYASTQHDGDDLYYRRKAWREEDPDDLSLVPDTRRVEELLSGDIHIAAETLLGMNVFLGGISDREYSDWKKKKNTSATHI